MAAALSLCGSALVQEPWQFLLVFGLIGGSLGTGPAALLQGAVVPKWFIRRRGRAVATATMGTGLAGFVLAPLVTIVSDAIGWRLTWAALGVLVLVIAALPSFLLVTQPEDVGLEPDGDGPQTRPDGRTKGRSDGEYSFTAGDAFKTQTLWLLIAVAIFGGVTNSAYPASMVSVYVDRGFSAAQGAAALSGYGLMSFASRFFWGGVADRLHVRTLLLMVAVYSGAAIPMFLVLPGNSVLAAGALAGVGTGGWVALSQVVWGEYFGRANLGSIVGKTRPLITLFGAVGPIYIAAMADLTGNYNASIGVFALSWVLCALCLLFVKPPRIPAPRTHTAGARAEQAVGRVAAVSD
jgi:MFS family permease